MADKDASGIVDSALDSIEKLGAAMNSNEQTFKKYGDSVNAVSSTVSKAFEKFGAVGGVAADFTKAIGSAVNKVNEQNDAYLGLYKDLGKFGGSIGTTADGFKQLTQVSNISQSQLKEFGDLIVKQKINLLSLGSSAGDGALAFAKLTTLTNDQTQAFNRLGVDQEKYRELAAEYVNQQALTGQTNLKNTTQQREAVARYVENLTELSAVTGKQRDDLIAAQKAAALDIQFQAKQRELRLKGDADSLKEAEENEKLLTAARAQGGEELANLVRDVTVNGRAMSEATAKTSIAYQGAVEANIAALKRGEVTQGEANKKIGEAGQQYFDQNLKLIQVGGEEAAKQIGINKDFLKTVGDLTASNAAVTEETIKAQKGAPQEIADLDSQRRNTEAKAQKATTEFVDTISKAVNPSLGLLNKGLGASIDAVTTFTKKYSGLIGSIGNRISAGAAAASGGAVGNAQATLPMEGRSTQTVGPNNRPVAAQRSGPQVIDINIDKSETADYSDFQQYLKPVGGTTQGGQIRGTLKESMKKTIDALASAGFKNVQILALNDTMHQDKDPDSKHSQGLAADFALDPAPTEEQRVQLLNIIKEAGFNKVLDEYTIQSKGGLGPHFHAELAKGGITAGPSLAGEKGPEAVVPLPDGRTIPVEIIKNNAGDNAELMAAIQSLSAESSKSIEPLISTLSEKLDTMIDYLRSSASSQEDLVMIQRNS